MSWSTQYALDPLEAYNGVMGFAARRGRSALRLAMHGAMPEVLRPELLHQLRLNFVPDSLGELAVEADVLFAPFCEDLGNGYFRFDAASRLLLLQELDTTYGEWPRPRSQRVAAFLSAYVEQERSSGAARLDALYRDYLEVEAWVALGFLDPAAAAEQLAKALADRLSPSAVAARARIGAIAGALSVPLAAHPQIVSYAAAVDALERGDTATGRRLVQALGEGEITIGAVTLPSPAEALAPKPRPVSAPPPPDEPSVEAQTEPPSERPSGTQSQRPRRHLGKALIICSPNDLQYAQRLIKEFVENDDIERAEVIPTSMERRIPALVAESTAVVQLIGRQSDFLGRMRTFLGLAPSPQSVHADVVRRQKPVVFALLPGAARDRLESELSDVGGVTTVPLRDDSWSEDVARLTDALMRAAADAEAGARDERETPAGVDSPRAPSSIYISHRPHSESLAARLHDVLKGRGYPVILDIAPPPRGDYIDFLEATLEDVFVMLVVIDRQWIRDTSRRSKGRDHFVEEVAYALRRGIPIVPLLIDGIPFPVRTQLPVELHALQRFQGLPFSDTALTEGLPLLLRAVEQARQTASSPGPDDVPPSIVAAPHAILFVGHTIDRPGRPQARFPARYEKNAGSAIRQALEQQIAGHPGTSLHGIASGSDGGDILFHEVCEELEIPSTLYLPVPPNPFVEEFLEPAGANWTARFHRLVRHLRIRVVDPASADDQGDEWRGMDYRREPWYANGRAMLQAATAPDVGSTLVMALWNGEWGGPGGPADIIERARDRGIQTLVIDTNRLFKLSPPVAGPTAGSASGVRTIKIFLAATNELREDRDGLDLALRQENDRLRSGRIHIEVTRWEDFFDSTSKSRLQDEFNDVVRQSDIFVSLVTTATSTFTREAFKAALQEFRDRGRPFIYTYFKRKSDRRDDEHHEDPVVSDFKDELQRMGHFPSEYGDLEDLKRQFRNQLQLLLDKGTA